MALTGYYFDTYAFYELLYQNTNYTQFSKNVKFITSKLNLMELYYGLLCKFGKDTAETYYNRFMPYCVDIDDEVIKQAMVFKSLNKKRRLSYVDCIGYILARSKGLKFLTGDKEFESFDNVEFVK